MKPFQGKECHIAVNELILYITDGTVPGLQRRRIESCFVVICVRVMNRSWFVVRVLTMEPFPGVGKVVLSNQFF